MVVQVVQEVQEVFQWPTTPYSPLLAAILHLTKVHRPIHQEVQEEEEEEEEEEGEEVSVVFEIDNGRKSKRAREEDLLELQGGKRMREEPVISLEEEWVRKGGMERREWMEEVEEVGLDLTMKEPRKEERRKEWRSRRKEGRREVPGQEDPARLIWYSKYLKFCESVQHPAPAPWLVVQGRGLDLHLLHATVQAEGGYQACCAAKAWVRVNRVVAAPLPPLPWKVVREVYREHLLAFEGQEQGKVRAFEGQEQGKVARRPRSRAQ